jgi:nucleotide-binding universal stress UspA family protein
MYKSIMVPLDGSPFSEEALPTAIRLARGSGARLLLARVVDRSVPSILLSSPLADQSWAESPVDHATDYLEDVAARILASTGVRTEIAVLRGGVASSLRAEAARAQCDLIVMSTHAHGVVGRVFQSSVADRLARSVACPVLLIRAHGIAFDWSVHRRFLHVLVPLDGTTAAESALSAAVEIANIDDARLTLMHVAQPQLVGAHMSAAPFSATYSPDGIEPEDTERMSREYLDTIAASLQSRRVRPFTDVRVVNGAPADEIVHFAEDNGVDLIAMATRAQGGVRRLVMGSTTTSVLYHATAAIMLLPPPRR